MSCQLILLQYTHWRFAACQIMFSYFIKLGAMFAMWKIPPAIRWNGKQTIQLKKL